ncbi:hypothetical protein SLS62_006146 [Diatrype stigma]|uniref:Clr5 domain-containing protein n=1 Tax=Diatrype stigma TaxID=117547 RepID=A0AAN9UNH9_9PEZI
MASNPEQDQDTGNPTVGKGFQRQWATTQDWATHKKTIVDLYSNQSLTLKQVVATMRNKHEFFATEAMYKRRLKIWGISKNVKRKVTSKLQCDPQDPPVDDSPDTATQWPEPQRATEIREERTDTKKSRALELRHGSSSHVASPEITMASKAKTPAVLGISCRRPAPGPSVSALYSIESPQDLQSFERWMALVCNYVPAAVETGLWKPLPGGTFTMNQDLIAWYNRTRAYSFGMLSGDTRQAFRAIGTCLDEYKDMMASQDPLFILFTLHTILPVGRTQNADIALAVFRYMRDIARVVHPRSHPMRLMMEHLFQIGLEKIAENSGHFLRPYFSLMCTVLGPHVEPLAESFAAIARANGTHDPSELAVAGVYTVDIINRLASCSETFAFEILGLRLARTWNLLRRGLLACAQQTTAEVLASPEASRYPIILASCYQINLHIFLLEGNHERALEAAHAWVAYSIEHFGMASYVTIDALGSLESYLRKVGDDRGADQAFGRLAVATGELNRSKATAKRSAQKR